MVNDPNEIVLDMLRAMRNDITHIKQGQMDLKSEMIGIKKQLHLIQGEALRREESIGIIQHDMDRIKSRLELSDA